MSGFTSVYRDGTFVVGVDTRGPDAPSRDEAQILVQRPGWQHLRWMGTATWLSSDLRWQLWDRDGGHRGNAGDLFTILQLVADDRDNF